MDGRCRLHLPVPLCELNTISYFSIILYISSGIVSAQSVLSPALTCTVIWAKDNQRVWTDLLQLCLAPEGYQMFIRIITGLPQICHVTVLAQLVVWQHVEPVVCSLQSVKQK